MKVKDVMTQNPVVCHPGNNLAELAAMMWEHACGAIPVVGDSGVVTGILTDRDLYIALGTRNMRPSEVLASDVSPPHYFSCSPEDDIRDALRIMAAQEVHRLPVTDAEGKLTGILSIDDVILHAGPDSPVSLSDVVGTLQAIRGQRTHLPPAVRPAAALSKAAGRK